MTSPDSAVVPKTPFAIGSITKTYVAALIMRLAEQGKLALGDRLARWLPNYPNADNIRLRQLLSHTSGVANHFEHADYNNLVFNRPTYHWQPGEILSTFMSKPTFAPGADYRYSNTGYVLLSLVAEKAAGRSLSEQLSKQFYVPLGLTRSHIQSAGPPPTHSAKGYLFKSSGTFGEWSDSTGYRPTRSAATVAWAAGDMVPSAGDTARWMQALYGGSVLSDSSLAAMTDYARYPRAKYGLGTFKRVLDGRLMHGHTGSLRGFVSSAWYMPSAQVSAAVLTNRGRIDANPIANLLLRQVLKDTTPPTVPVGLKATARAGRYIDLSWKPSTDNAPGTISYRVFRNGVAIGSRQTALSLTNRVPSVGTYKYKVRAFDGAGNRSAKSPPVSVVALR